jgi:hypothetical protein
MQTGKKGQPRQQYILESTRECSGGGGGKPQTGIFCDLIEAYVVTCYKLITRPRSPADCPRSSNRNEIESFLEAAKAQNWAVEPQEKRKCCCCCKPRYSSCQIKFTWRYCDLMVCIIYSTSQAIC